MASTILSMTGFSSFEGEIGDTRLRIEIKSLNHRFLDVKVRIPREYSSAEIPIRSFVQTKLNRGSVELKIERARDAENNTPEIQPNLALAAHYYEAMTSIQKTLGLTDNVRTAEIASFPDVIHHGASDLTAEDAWQGIKPLIDQAFDRLINMRKQEGAALVKFINEALAEIETNLARLQERRLQCENAYADKLKEKLKAIFEAHPLPQGNIQPVIETRLAQELALLVERTDIQEELTRLQNHIKHFKQVLGAGGPAGRKLDFILQEMNREINTAGNKAQDFPISEEVVSIKVKLEQIREQAMNIE
jgi:uncharacterized protein (TIGR00255 family)